MSTHEQERATGRTYHGPVNVTPEREQVWKLWKDDYVVSCVSSWRDQGSTEQECLEAAAVVYYELGLVDGVAWMPLGRALGIRMRAQMGEASPVEGEGKTDFINALRTAQTSTRGDRVQCAAYQLGISVLEASKYIGTDAAYEPDAGNKKACALYRHFDIDGALLYVGIAKEPEKRGEQHRSNSKWHRFVSATTTTWFDSREEAARAERLAIESESPIFNQTHNKRNRDAAVAYLFNALPPSESALSVAAKAGGAA